MASQRSGLNIWPRPLLTAYKNTAPVAYVLGPPELQATAQPDYPDKILNEGTDSNTRSILP
jgi:hypothetical protein